MRKNVSNRFVTFTDIAISRGKEGIIVKMERSIVLEKYKKSDERLLVSKLLDKIDAVEKQNKVQNTQFLSPVELQILKKVLNSISYKNYTIYGGTETAQRRIIILYPCKLEELFQTNRFNFNTICTCIRISNSTENFEHKQYLGGLIKLGVKREKIGDIIVHNNGADIIVDKDISKFLYTNLQQLTRFKNCSIDIINLSDIIIKEQEYKYFKIIVSSLRLDNIIAKSANTSRNKACEILKQERVFVNYENEVRNTKIVKNDDIITIRGIGKFVISGIEGNTRSGRFVINVKKFL